MMMMDWENWYMIHQDHGQFEWTVSQANLTKEIARNNQEIFHVNNYIIMTNVNYIIRTWSFVAVVVCFKVLSVDGFHHEMQCGSEADQSSAGVHGVVVEEG